MTNDIATLNGALTELGETMADNLNTMGVNASASDGLTTLANKILDITPVAPTVKSITLTGDKSVLSAYDSDTVLLSATVKDQNGNAMQGQSVVFKQGSTTLATKSTNSNGVASYTYESAGAGDVSFTASVGSLVSGTYGIEDCIFYGVDEITSNTTSDNYKILASLSTLPNQFLLSFDYKTNAESRVGLFSSNNFSGNPNYSVFVGSPDGSSKWYYGGRTTSTNTTDVTGSPTGYHSYTITRDGNYFYYQRDGIGNYNRNYSWFDNYSYVIGMMGWGTNKESTIKNIKLKKL